MTEYIKIKDEDNIGNEYDIVTMDKDIIGEIIVEAGTDTDAYHIRKDVFDWVAVNLGLESWRLDDGIYFYDDTDAMAFKLRWL